jgi:hypothetical protein
MRTVSTQLSTLQHHSRAQNAKPKPSLLHTSRAPLCLCLRCALRRTAAVLSATVRTRCSVRTARFTSSRTTRTGRSRRTIRSPSRASLLQLTHPKDRSAPAAALKHLTSRPLAFVGTFGAQPEDLAATHSAHRSTASARLSLLDCGALSARTLESAVPTDRQCVVATRTHAAY